MRTAYVRATCVSASRAGCTFSELSSRDPMQGLRRLQLSRSPRKETPRKRDLLIRERGSSRNFHRRRIGLRKRVLEAALFYGPFPEVFLYSLVHHGCPSDCDVFVFFGAQIGFGTVLIEPNDRPGNGDLRTPCVSHVCSELLFSRPIRHVDQATDQVPSSKWEKRPFPNFRICDLWLSCNRSRKRALSGPFEPVAGTQTASATG